MRKYCTACRLGFVTIGLFYKNEQKLKFKVKVWDHHLASKMAAEQEKQKWV